MNRQGEGMSKFANDQPGTPGFKKLQQAGNTEGGLDPFVYPGFLLLNRKGPIQGTVLRRDTFNVALGAGREPLHPLAEPAPDVLLHLPALLQARLRFPRRPGPPGLVPEHRGVEGPPHHRYELRRPGGRQRAPLSPTSAPVPSRRRPVPQHAADHDVVLRGRIIPSYGMFYDWQGAFVFQPGVTYLRDPFRFITDYTRVEAAPTGQFGTVRDRDNVRFQVEYVF
jgi:hypothetical protein